MNIAMLHDSLEELTGGSSMSTLRFAELLSKKGHKVIFLTSGSHKKRCVRYYVSGKCRIKEYFFFSIPLQEKIGRHFSLAIPRYEELEEIFKKEQIEILHIMLPFFASFRAMQVAKKLGIKIIFHSHMEPENFFFQIHRKFKEKRLIHLFYRYLIENYKSGNMIICPTKYSKKVLKKLEKKLKIVVITNGVDTSKFRKIRNNPFYKKYHQNSNIFRILFLGRLDAEKNIYTLIKAAPYLIERFGNIRIDIVGDGIVMPELKKLASKLNLKNYVKFWGRVKNEETVYFYNAADIFVLPSVVEIEGMVVLEAMACGKPVLIANSEKNAARSFVKNNGFLFDTLDPRDLSEKAIKILENPKLKEKMEKKSLKKAKKFDIDRSLNMLEKTYKKVLKEKNVRDVETNGQRKFYKKILNRMVSIAKLIELR